MVYPITTNANWIDGCHVFVHMKNFLALSMRHINDANNLALKKCV